MNSKPDPIAEAFHRHVDGTTNKVALTPEEAAAVARTALAAGATSRPTGEPGSSTPPGSGPMPTPTRPPGRL